MAYIKKKKRTKKVSQMARQAVTYTPFVKPSMYALARMFNQNKSQRGGYRTSKHGSYTGIVTTDRRKKKARSGSVKGIMYGLKPAKHYTMDNNAALLHNTVYTMCPSQGITQGTGNANRLGDRVHLEALKIQANFQSSATAGAYSYRILVGYSGEEYTTANIASQFVSGLGTTQLFFPSTVNFWTVNGIVNPKAFTVLYDQTVDINSQITAVSDVVSYSHTVPLGIDFPYQDSGSVQGKFKNLYIVVIGCVAGGTSGVTAAGNILFSGDLIFKD